MKVSSLLLIRSRIDNGLPFLSGHARPLLVVVSQQSPHGDIAKECNAHSSERNGMTNNIPAIRCRFIDLARLEEESIY